MSREIYESIPRMYRRRLNKPCNTLWITGANDSIEPVVDKVGLRLDIAGNKVDADFLVIARCDTGMILGIRLLAEIECIIHCASKTATLFSDRPAYGLRDETIGVGRAGRIRVRIGNKWNGRDVLFEPDGGLQSRLMRAESGVYRVHQGCLDIHVYNAGLDPTVLKRDTMVGTVSGYDPAIDPGGDDKACTGEGLGGDTATSWENVPQDGGLGQFMWEAEEPFKFDLSGTLLDREDRQSLLHLLESNRDVFATKYSEMAECTVAMQDIELIPGTRPFRTPPRRMHPRVKSAVDRVLKELLEAGIITRSISDWAAALVPVVKKDSSVRICVDYRELNKHVKFDTHPLTTAEGIFQGIAENKPKIFSKADCFSGYFSVPLTKRAQDYTTFVTPDACYKFTRLPQGLRTSGAAFSRAMETMLRGVEGVYFYLDDVIVTGKDPKEHGDRLSQVFQRFREGGMRLKPSKCDFAKPEITFLGFTVNENGLATTNELIDKVRNFPVPGRVKDVRAWLGLTGFYRKFVANYPDITKPLTKLLRKDVRFEWGVEQQEAFDKLRECLTTAPLLRHPDFGKPFILRADSSGYAIGAVLSQECDDGECPVAFWGRKLSDPETRYHITELEALAVVAALKRFEPIVRYQEITVYTDHSPLIQLLGSARQRSSPRIQRWGLYLATYHIKVVYKPGRLQQVPDALSRRSYDQDQSESRDWDEWPLIGNEIFNEDKQARMVGTRRHPDGIRKHDGQSTPPITEGQSDDAESEADSSGGQDSPATQMDGSTLSVGELRDRQAVDPFCSEMMGFIGGTDIPADNQKARKLTLQAEYFGIEEGVLVRYPPVSRKSQKKMLEVRRCNVIPDSMVGDLLYSLHDVTRAGHVGRDALITRVISRYWWPGMLADIYAYVKTCPVCQRRKVDTHRTRAPLQPYGVPEGFMQTVTSDVAGPLCPSGKAGSRFIIMFACAYSGLVLAFPAANHTAETVANLFVHEVCLKYGVTPKRFHSDRGTDYTSRLMGYVCKLMGTEKTLSVAYNPRSNGLSERNVGLLKDRLSCMLKGNPRRWADFVSWAAYAINSTPSAALGGLTPHFVAFQREASCPLDTSIDLPEGTPKNVRDYVSEMIEKLEYTDEVVRESRLNAQAKRKARHDLGLQEPNFKSGDLVWKLTKTPNQADKLRYRYGGPYQLLSSKDGIHFRYRRVRDNAVSDTMLHIAFAKRAYIDQSRPKPTKKVIKEARARAEIEPPTSLDKEDWAWDPQGKYKFPNLMMKPRVGQRN